MNKVKTLKVREWIREKEERERGSNKDFMNFFLAKSAEFEKRKGNSKNCIA